MSSGIADLYLSYIAVVSKQDHLALCIFPVDELLPLCDGRISIREGCRLLLLGSSYPVSVEIHVPLRTSFLHSCCFVYAYGFADILGRFLCSLYFDICLCVHWKFQHAVTVMYYLSEGNG